MDQSSTHHRNGKGTRAELEKAAADLEKEKLIAEIQIERMVLLARHNQELDKTNFVFAAFNHFVYENNTGIHSPAEFSACEFALHYGKMSILSTLINPGELCLGQTFKAMHHSNNTHQLPLPPNAEGESMSKVYRDIIKYLKNCLNGKPLIVFTPTQEVAIVKSCFDYMQTACELDYTDDSDDEDGKKDPLPPILVYDIQYLFFYLKKETMGMMGQPNEGIKHDVTNAIFLRDFFEFEERIACQFHEEIDRSRYCTRSQVVRWVYTFCDYMCKDLGITMEPGKHAPFFKPLGTSSD
ncbi:protein maelstrom-like [Drosophila willistoni]|uniref:protein maelstrom-like n=1 Tax=Drosophila willistoni TaxID=7260 RepID=UPI001F0788EF|nr:protein maelstrom-like [Drosophila willistoni]XP_046865313.1 protein maelstrom-like [Drosophila willistoni]